MMSSWAGGTDGNQTALRFDSIDGYTPPRLRIAWLENTLDCRTWTYYCDLKDAMSRIHELCVPRGSSTCIDGRRGFQPQLVVAGPRYMANVAHPDETLGFNRARYPYLPLAVIQNKMYAASTREIVGDASAKLQWARAAGASVGFTWLPTQHIEFSSLSGIPHHRLPFGVDAALYGKHAAELDTRPTPYEYDIGFTGASSNKYPLREAIIRQIKALGQVKAYLGTWQQTALRTTDNRSWKALDRDGYVLQISKTKMWVSTTGPSNIVGTRYFEILASGTTMLLCNKAPAGVYDGLLKDGVHAVIFDGMDDLKAKILYYLANEPARRKIVDAALALTRRIHTWDARALFITRAVEAAMKLHDPKLPHYIKPADIREPPEPYLACLDGRRSASAFTEIAARRPLRRYTVATCAAACRRRSTHFAVMCGGFCSGNGHRLARCFCAKVPYLGSAMARKKQKIDCSTTCTLHDSRPCGGWDALAVYSLHANPMPGNASEEFAPIEPAITELRNPRLRGKQGGGGRGGRPPWMPDRGEGRRGGGRGGGRARGGGGGRGVSRGEAVEAAAAKAISEAPIRHGGRGNAPAATPAEGAWSALLSRSAAPLDDETK